VTDPSFPADVDTPDSVIERWKEIEEEECAVSPDSGRNGGDS